MADSTDTPTVPPKGEDNNQGHEGQQHPQPEQQGDQQAPPHQAATTTTTTMSVVTMAPVPNPRTEGDDEFIPFFTKKERKKKAAELRASTARATENIKSATAETSTSTDRDAVGASTEGVSTKPDATASAVSGDGAPVIPEAALQQPLGDKPVPELIYGMTPERFANLALDETEEVEVQSIFEHGNRHTQPHDSELKMVLGIKHVSPEVKEKMLPYFNKYNKRLLNRADTTPHNWPSVYFDPSLCSMDGILSMMFDQLFQLEAQRPDDSGQLWEYVQAALQKFLADTNHLYQQTLDALFTRFEKEFMRHTTLLEGNQMSIKSQYNLVNKFAKEWAQELKVVRGLRENLMAEMRKQLNTAIETKMKTLDSKFEEFRAPMLGTFKKDLAEENKKFQADLLEENKDLKKRLAQVEKDLSTTKHLVQKDHKDLDNLGEAFNDLVARYEQDNPGNGQQTPVQAAPTDTGAPQQPAMPPPPQQPQYGMPPQQQYGQGQPYSYEQHPQHGRAPYGQQPAYYVQAPYAQQPPQGDDQFPPGFGPPTAGSGYPHGYPAPGQGSYR
ncbi:hypothetical protein LTR37_008608 [Vermiconidia calcicola]|uniref:Uncharacterized protein n=1 Tax=Vermiconidia calcicola TaxID=1690605 RepID=A0ACC3NBB8_9PEZI|nr:hypothetical protein LTR37_008608 [Vermiconidia calcicola]